jgi:hypothetical protein
MGKVSSEGSNPGNPPPAEYRVPAPYGSAENIVSSQYGMNRFFWFESGYNGEYPYPGTSTIHGINFGAALYFSKHFVPAFHVGWLGVRHEESNDGDILSSRFPVDLALRISFPVGPTLFAIAPVARFDTVVVKRDPIGKKDGIDMEFEFMLGGMTTWNLPLPKGKAALIIGAGVLAALVGDDYRLNDLILIPRTTLRIVWSVGFTWNLKPVY